MSGVWSAKGYKQPHSVIMPDTCSDFVIEPLGAPNALPLALHPQITSSSRSSIFFPTRWIYLSILISIVVTQVLAPLINWQTPEETWGRLQVTRPWLLSRISWSTDALVPLTPPAARTDSTFLLFFYHWIVGRGIVTLWYLLSDRHFVLLYVLYEGSGLCFICCTFTHLIIVVYGHFLWHSTMTGKKCFFLLHWRVFYFPIVIWLR